MGELSRQGVEVAVALLPGFLSVKVKDFFKPKRHSSHLDQVFEVVAFAVGNYVFAWVVLSIIGQSIGVFPESLFVLGLSSILFGTVCGVIVGRDYHYRFARWTRLTTRTGRDDVWQDAFGDMRKNWLLIHLGDERRVLGWARYFSDDGKSTSVFLKDASWVDDDGQTSDIEGPGILLTEAAQIRYVEFFGEGESR